MMVPPTRRPSLGSRPALALLLGLLLAGLVLAGCDGSNDGGVDAGAPEPGVELAPGSELRDAEVADDQAAGSGVGVAGVEGEPVVLADRAVIYRVDLVLEVDDVAAGAQEAAAVAERFGGFVQSETTFGTGSGGIDPGYAEDYAYEYGIEPPFPPFPPTETSAVVVLRVPASEYEDAVSELESLGEVVSRSRNADDVTDRVVDVEARIETQQTSIDRLQQLLTEAEDIGDVLAIETELTRRVADLESLQAQLAQLENQTDLATVTVTLYPPETVVEEGTGFVAGLRAGWDAFGRAVVVGMTALGAILPFLAALALVTVPLVALLVVRHRRRRQAATVPAQPTAQASGPAEPSVPSAPEAPAAEPEWPQESGPRRDG